MDKVILENIVKMLTERKFLDVNNLEKNYTNLLKEYTDERIFKIKSDFSKEIYYLMMLPDKINTIKKVQNLEQFCANAGDNKKIIVGNFALKAYKQFLEKYNNIEIFFKQELLINIIEHELQPKFILLSEEEKKKKMEEYNLKQGNLQKMLKTDVIARYYNAKVGDIFRIIRPSFYSGEGYTYRIVTEASLQNLV
tara:strand:- start:1207 stop:1791 length:585 start_codon:yes stop_codon:yes gene_type:complete